MARWLVCFLVFLQVCFLVLSEETTVTVSPSPQDAGSVTESSSKEESTSTPKVTPTRGTSSTKTQPPLDHGIATTTMAPKDSSKTNNATENKKNAALSVYSFSQIVMISMLGVLLSASAI